MCSTGVSAKGEIFSGDVLVRSIENVMGPQVNIYGGMAGDDGTFTGTYVFTYEKESDEGIAALVLDEEKDQPARNGHFRMETYWNFQNCNKK